MPRLIAEQQFEDRYRLKFEQLLQNYGVLINFDRDRAATDVGIQLTEAGSLELSSVRVWFQLKGIQSSTLPAERLASSEQVAVTIDLDRRFWYASRQATCLVVYIEAVDLFIAEVCCNSVLC